MVYDQDADGIYITELLEAIDVVIIVRVTEPVILSFPYLLQRINDDDLETIAERFDVFESDILLLKESILRILMGVSAVVSAIDKSKMGEELANKQKKKTNAQDGLPDKDAQQNEDN